MSDIYKPPQSDLEVDAELNKRPHGIWRVFFWINIGLAPLSLLALLVLPKLGPLDYIDMLIFLYSLPGLYSYAYNKRLLPATVWKFSFALYLMWFLGYEIIGPLLIEMAHYGEPAVIDAYITISLAFTLPTAYVFYRLGFRSN